MEQITIEVIIRHITDIPIRGGLTMTNIPRISTEDVPATHLFLRHNPHPLSPTTAGVEGEGGRWTDSRPHNPPLPAPRPSPPQMKIPHPCHRVPVLSSSQTDSRLSTPGWRKVRETTQVIYNYNLGPNYSVCFLFIFGRLFFLFRVQCVKRLMSDLHSVFFGSWGSCKHRRHNVINNLFVMITKYSLCLVRRVNIGTIPCKGVMLQILPVL